LLSLFIKLQIQLILGDDSSISVGWQKKDEKSTATGEIKVNLKTIQTILYLLIIF